MRLFWKGYPLAIGAAALLASIDGCTLALDIDGDFTLAKTSEGGAPGVGGTTTSGGMGGEGGEGGEGGCDATLCGESCVDTSTDASHCGDCDNACHDGFSCEAGLCGHEVVAVSGGGLFSCALLRDETVWCWGYNDGGQLGVEPSASDNNCGGSKCRATAQQIPDLTEVVALDVGNYHACAAKSDGTLWCWGTNSNGQLAQSTGLIDHSATPLQVVLPAGTEVVHISAAQEGTCVRTSDGDVYCWGANAQAQVGTTAGGVVTTPNLVSVFNHDVIDVQLGDDVGSGSHACAIRADKSLWCWGGNANGELGTNCCGGGTDCGGYCNKTPAQVPIEAVASLGVGPAVSCAVQESDGKVFCWGANSGGQLGQAGPVFTVTPLEVPLPEAAARVVVASWSQFAVTAAGDVYGWGWVHYGALANGQFTATDCNGYQCTFDPEEITSLAGIAELAFNRLGGVAIMLDGSVTSWGLNAYAALGHLPFTAGDTTCNDDTPCATSAVPVIGLP